MAYLVKEAVKARTLDLIIDHLNKALMDCRRRERMRAKIALRNIARFIEIAKTEVR